MTTMFHIFCLMGLVAVGYFARRRGVITEAGTSDMARIVVSIVYPALILVSMVRLSASDLAANWTLPVMTMVIALAGLGLGLLLVRLLGRVPPETARAFLFHCLVNNYLFLPLPLVLLYFGEYGVSLLVFSSVGYELIVWTLGVLLLARGTSLGERLRIMFGPSFSFLIGSLVFVFLRDHFQWSLPGTGWARHLSDTFLFGAGILGQATVGLSLLVAGSRFATLKFQTMFGWRVWFVSVIRLVLIPAALLPLILVIPMQPVARGVLCIIAVMPSAMVSVIFSERFGGDREFIAGALLLTHLWALITVPLFLMFVL